MTEATESTTFRDALSSAETEHATTKGGETAGETTETTETEAAPTYKVKVDGQEVEVGLDDLLQGYSRQEDYTRKTQALASERQRLAQAEALYAQLDEDPAGTLAQLAAHFNLAPDALVGNEEEQSPLEKEVNELKSFAAQQQEAQLLAGIETEISRIQQEYGDPDLDPNVLLQHAVDREIGNLDAAYRDLKFTDLHNKQREAQRAAEDAAAEEAKRQAAVVEGGASRSGGTVPNTSERPSSVRQAMEETLREMNLA